MSSPIQLTNIIDGKAVTGSSDTIRTVLNPSTGEVVAELTESTIEDADRAVAAARAAFPAWSAKTPGERSQILHELANLLEANLDELAHLETIDAGKPTTAATGDELPGIVAAFRHFAGAGR
ncbi:aldehyde dehydrogenase family protein, partial [Rhodococcus sp. NPDC057014]